MDSSTAESGVVDNWVIAAGISEAETSDAAEGSFILGFSDTADLFTSFCSIMDKAVECAANFSEFPLKVVLGIIFLAARIPVTNSGPVFVLGTGPGLPAILDAGSDPAGTLGAGSGPVGIICAGLGTGAILGAGSGLGGMLSIRSCSDGVLGTR